MSQDDLFEQILASLHEAMLDDSHWRKTSALIDEACRSKGNHLAFSTRTPDDDVQVFFTRFCYRGEHRTDLEREYLRAFLAVDDHLPALRKLPDGKIVHVTETIPGRALEKSLAYNEMMPRYEFQDGLNVRLDGPRGSNIVFGIADPVDRRGWSSARIAMVERLLPHVRQFARVRHALVESQALATSLTGLLECTGAGVIQLDARGKILDVNDRARAFLRSGALGYSRGGPLRAPLPHENVQLQRLLRQALPPAGAQGQSGSMAITSPAGRPYPALHVIPVRHPGTGMRAWKVAALVLIADPKRIPPFDRELVQAAFGLTAAETEVAVMLAEGNSVREIGAATGRRESSIRAHVKRILGKLSLSRQSQVVRLVLSFSGVPRGQMISPEAEAKERSPPPAD